MSRSFSASPCFDHARQAQSGTFRCIGVGQRASAAWTTRWRRWWLRDLSRASRFDAMNVDRQNQKGRQASPFSILPAAIAPRARDDCVYTEKIITFVAGNGGKRLMHNWRRPRRKIKTRGPGRHSKREYEKLRTPNSRRPDAFTDSIAPLRWGAQIRFLHVPSGEASCEGRRPARAIQRQALRLTAASLPRSTWTS